MKKPWAMLAACGVALSVLARAQAVDELPPASSADAGAMENAAARQARDVAAAVQDITAAIRADDDVPAGAVTVAVHADTVVLSGTVGTAAQAARALSIAQQHADGVRVTSHVEVREEAEASVISAQALALVHEVERALKQDRRTTSLGVAVSIDDDQVVSLHGLVPSRESRAAAEEVAARVSGVKRVSSRLVVPGE
jgi:osmotically-inducible protein OsmY